MAFASDAGTGIYDHIGFNDSIVANHHILADGGEIADFYIVANNGFWTDVV